ncbi:MAG: amino acid permease-associated region [Firmicutes bacterium]|nr:amino acid permease-associated region [Bacillota bacterium]
MDIKKNILEEDSKELKRDLGLFAAIAVVMGQMIGSGIYMTPQGLAQLANPKAAILAMVITGTGTLLLALCFAKMGEKMPASGSAVVYTKKAFGNLPAFFVGWSYWCGCWIANGAIILGGISYATYFFPILADNGLVKALICVCIIWLYTLINIRGIKHAGYINLFLTVVKLLPLLVFLVIAMPNFHIENLNTLSSPEVSGLSVLPVAIAYSLWSFTGFEGASMIAGEVKDVKTVRLATIIGTGLVFILYLLLVVVAAGNMSQANLSASGSPFADIIYNITGGYWAGGFISLGVCISAFGCVGAWVLSSARVAFSLGEQKLFPDSFSKLHPEYRTPYFGLIINAILMSVVMFLGCLTNQGRIYNFLVLFATMSLLVFYAFGAASEIKLFATKTKAFNPITFIKDSMLGLAAFAYAVYTIYGSGGDVVMYGFIFMMIGIPVYIYVQLKNEKVDLDNEEAS